jgi:hypothetical protein
MAKRATKKLIANTCEICGKKFFSSKQAKFCVDNSTCRVKHHQREKQAKRVSESLTMHMEAFTIYQGFVTRFPETKIDLDRLFFDNGIDALMSAIKISSFVAHAIIENPSILD